MVLGGEKSGKSAFVRRMAKGYANVLCLVTVAPVDESVYFQHVCSRPIEWDVLEEPVALAICLLSNADAYDLIILDDIGVWLSNVIALRMNVYYEIDCVLDALCRLKAKLVVSKELGLGLLSNSALALEYVNLLNCVNQLLARTLSSVYFVIASQAIKIK
ncbi:Adenosylcobinamide kinase [Candidatus Hodgkinia cicadicola]|nr:Adenosylcobinamide kinase [Candidatus Hodgkinia cicadicola]